MSEKLKRRIERAIQRAEADVANIREAMTDAAWPEKNGDYIRRALSTAKNEFDAACFQLMEFQREKLDAGEKLKRWYRWTCGVCHLENHSRERDGICAECGEETRMLLGVTVMPPEDQIDPAKGT